MSLSRYRGVLRLPGVSRLLVFGLLARMPHAGAALALTLHVVQGLGEGYAAAGLVGTASTIGQALGGPWRGLAVDRWGLRRALLPSVVVEALVWGSAPFLGFRALIVASLIGGLLGLPTFTIVRQSLSVLVPPEMRRSAYAMDAMAVELTYLLGPTVVVVAALKVGTTSALLGVGTLMVVSGIGLMIFNPPTRSTGQESVAAAGPSVTAGMGEGRGMAVLAEGDADPGRGAVRGLRSGDPTGDPSGDVGTGRPPGAELRELRRGRPAGPGVSGRREWFGPALVAVLCATTGTTFVLSGTDVGLVALLRERDQVPLLGMMFAFWCGGSLLGALVYGALSRPVPPARLLLGLAVLTMPIGTASSPVVLAVLLLLAGGFCSPMITATTEAVSRLVPERSRGEAMGWHGSFLTLGVALGAPMAGAVMDHHAPWTGFVTVGVVGALLALAGLRPRRRRRITWDLRPGGSPERLRSRRVVVDRPEVEFSVLAPARRKVS